MTRLALRGLAARKLRTSLTVIAVLLGVTMIAGTFVLTDTIQKAFDEISSALERRASRTMRPSARNRMRSAWLAAIGSCVTMAIDCP